MQRLGRLRDADNGSRWRNPERSLGFKPNGRMGPPLGASLPMRMTYMRLLESRVFFDQHFFLLSVSRGSRERKFTLMHGSSLVWPH